MKSKISCFNKTIFKKNLTLYWPLWVAYLLMMLAAVPVNLYQYMRSYTNNPLARQYSALRSVFETASSPVLIFIFCVIAVMCVFSYLYTAKNANGIHGLPVTRLELFVTNALSAFIFLATSELISFIAGVFVGVSCGVTNIEVLLYLLLFQLGITFFGVAFATAVAMLTGHIMAMPVYCFIANYLYYIVREVLENLIVNVTYGLYDLWGMDITYVLSPLYYLERSVQVATTYNKALDRPDAITVSGGQVVAAYAGVGVLLFVFAYQLYRKRQLETAGDVIAVGFMKPVFRIGLGICGGTTLGLVISELFYFDTARYSDARFYIMLCFIIVCILIGYFMAEMLMQKSFRIFKKHIVIEAVASVAVMVVFLVALNEDAFGLERELPAQDEIVEAWVDLDYPVKYEGEELAELLATHALIIEQKDETIEGITNETVNCYSVTFKYVLADGSIFVRNYSLPIDTENPTNPELPSGQIITREMEPERFKQYLLGVNYDSNMYLSGYVYLYDQYQNYLEYRFSEEELEVIAEAILKDIDEGNLVYYEFYSINGSDITKDEFMNDIQLRYYNEEGIERIEDAYYDIPMYYEDGISVTGFGYAESTLEAVEVEFSSAVDSDSLYTRFGKNCTNLISALEELGIVNDTWHLYTHEEYNALIVDEK
ncbi:MAG: hypothetical protein IJZ23_00900 [Roseburia sp.]|nr:hypothetical protein [Roseburia sp.]